MKCCGPDSKKRQGKLYLCFAAAGIAQTLTAKTSASPTDTRPGSLAATGLFILVLEAKNYERCFLHAGNGEFSTQNEVRLSMRVTVCINFFDYFPLHRAQFQ